MPRFSTTTFLIACIAFEFIPFSARAEPSHDPSPYRKPEVVLEIRHVRDLLLNGEYDETLVACEQARKRYPDLLVWRFAAMLAPQARMLELHDWSLEKEYYKRWEELKQQAEETAKKRRLHASDHLIMGGAYGVHGLHQARARNYRTAFALGIMALRELSRARRADPRLDDVYLGYGIYHYYRGVLSGRYEWLPLFSEDRERGLNELERAGKGLFAEPLADLALLYLYKDEGKWKEGLEITRNLKSRYPGAMLLTQHEGYFLLRMGRYRQALDKFKEVLKKDPLNGAVHLYYGVTLYQLGRTDPAEREFWSCIHLHSSPEYKAYAYLFLGKAAMLNAKKGLAEKYREQAVEIYPDSRRVMKALDNMEHGE